MLLRQLIKGLMFILKIAKNWLNWVKPRAISRQRENLELPFTFSIPRFNPASQAFGVIGLGIIPDKINSAHMFIQVYRTLDEFQHYLTAFAFIYTVVYLAWVCQKCAKDNQFASGFPERRDFLRVSALSPLLARVWPHQIRSGFIKIKGYLASLVHTPKRPLNTVFLTSYSGSGEVIHRLERLYEYPSSAIILRIHSGLIALIILSVITTWHNPLKLQLLKASPNSLGLLLSAAIICFLCLSLISLGRPAENFWYKPAIPLWLNRRMYLRTLLRCKSTMLAISGAFNRWVADSQTALALLYNRVLVDLNNFRNSAFSCVDNFLTNIGRMVTSFRGNHYSRINHNMQPLFSRQDIIVDKINYELLYSLKKMLSYARHKV